MKRLVSGTLAATLVLLSPGLPAYRACAQTGRAVRAVPGALRAPAAPAATPPRAQAPSLAAPGLMGAAPAATLAPAAEQKPAAPVEAALAETAANGGDAAAPLSKLYDAAAKAESAASEVAAAPGAGAPALGASARDIKVSERRKPARAVEAAPRKVSWLSNAKRKLDVSAYTPSQKAYLAGQAMFQLAISVYLASLPLVVAGLTGSSDYGGTARLVHYWTLGGAALFAGAVVGRSPMKRVMVVGTAVRAALFGAIGVGMLTGALSWPLFLGLVALNAAAVAHVHLTDIDSGGAAKVYTSGRKDLSREEKSREDEAVKHVNELNSSLGFGLRVLTPAVLGYAIARIDVLLGPGAGAGAAFVLFSGIMGAAAFVYAKKVEILGEDVARTAGSAFRRAKESLRSFGRILLDTPGRNWRALRVVIANKAIRARWMVSLVESTVNDALFVLVIPAFALGVAGAGPFGLGLMVSSYYLGGFVASWLVTGRRKALEAKWSEYGYIKRVTMLGALAVLPTLALWTSSHIAVGAAAVFALKLMLQPLTTRMSQLLQLEIARTPGLRDGKAGVKGDDLFGLMDFVEVLAMGAGALAFQEVLVAAAAGAVAPVVPFQIVTAVLAAMSVLSFVGLRWVKQQLRTPTLATHASPEGNEARMLAQLAKSLEENGLPPARIGPAAPRTAEFPVQSRFAALARGAYRGVVDVVTRAPAKPAAAGADDRPTVVILAPGSRHKVAIAREGGRQAPGDVHLVMDASWLIQETYPDGRTRLLVRKGVVFDEKGQATVVEYERPRRVRYFADYFTLGANDRDDGVVFEKDLDVPQSNSLRLEGLVNDKLRTRLLMAAKGVSVPATLALLMTAHPLAAQASQFQAGSQGVSIGAMPASEDELAEAVGRFLDRHEGEELVVKPSGPQFHSGRGVKFFKRTQREEIVAHALALSRDPQMTADGAVLVDARVNSAPLERGGRRMETTLRTLVARTPWDGAVTTDVGARVGPWGKPTTAEAADPRDNAAVEPWQRLLSDWRESGLLPDEAAARALDAEVRAIGPAALLAIAAHEKTLPVAEGDSRQAQTDMIGLDVMIENRGGKLVPVVIEVNDHDSGLQYQFDQMHPERSGAHSREWVATMLQRARRDALKGKRIALVGAGYAGKRFIFERARKLGVEIVLVDKRTPFVAELLRDGLVSELVETDNTKPKEALAAARRKLARSVRRRGPIHGITGFWEDDVPLAADLAAGLGLPFHAPQAARIARSKYETRLAMQSAGLPTPVFHRLPIPPRPVKGDKEFAARLALHEESVEIARRELASIAKGMSYPAVLKPAFGAAALGVKKVMNAEEAAAAFEELVGMLVPEVDTLFKQGADIVFEEYLDGREYDVDIVMRGGEPVFSSVTDNWPTREPYFLATGSSLPSRLLTPAEQAEAARLAANTAKAIGLRDGVVHIEGKYTKDGARVIEANSRMGGEYVHDWVEAVWGVSLVEEGLMAAAGIPGRPFKAASPLTYLEGEFIIPSASGVVQAFALADEAREQPGFHELRIKKQVGERIAVPPDGYERVGMLVARGDGREAASRSLDALRAKLLLEVR